MIIVKSGGGLNIDGGVLSNAHIKALSGSSLIINDGGVITIQDSREFYIEEGAVFELNNGNININ